MIYPIVKYGQDVLEKPAEPIETFDGDLQKLVDDMFETMYAANGVGLAAPQIGILKRLCVIDVSLGKDPSAKLVLANPVVLSTEGKQQEEEGCLSLPDFHAVTKRPLRASLRAQDLDRKSTRLNSSHGYISYAVFCLKKKNNRATAKQPHALPSHIV